MGSIHPDIGAATTAADRAPARSGLASAAVFLACLALYVYTLQPGLSWGDGTRLQREAITSESFILAEMVTATFAPDPLPFARLGVAAWDHPLYVAIGHLLVRLLPGVSALWLVNLVSAVFAAGSVAMVYWLCARHARSRVAALGAAASLAVSHTFWFHAVTPEVYSLHTFLLLAALAAFLEFDVDGRLRWLSAAGLALGLAASNHLLAFLALPAMGLYALCGWRAGRPPPLWGPGQALWNPGQVAHVSGRRWVAALAAAGTAFAAGFALYVVQLVRMLRSFPLQEVMGPVVGETFFRGLLASTPLDLAVSVVTYGVFLLLQFGPLGVALGAVGLAVPAWRTAAPFKSLTASLFAVYALFGILYMVADQFAFFMTSYVVFALAIGRGLVRVAQSTTRRRHRWLIGLLALQVAVLPAVYHVLPGAARAAGLSDEALDVPQIGAGARDGLAYYVTPGKRGDYSAEVFGRETLAALPPNALVLAQWYTDTDEYFVLRYYVAVEGLRPDVEIVGWPTEDPFSFDSRLARDLVVSQVGTRPVYLASLSQRYYESDWLSERYCLIVEHNLYRVLPDESSGSCLP